MARKIDLHMHTVVSDGTDTPEEIVGKVKAAGIGLFAVTDHDAVGACETIGRLLGKGDPVLITGVEFSCSDELGKYHILGYGFDPDSPAVLRVAQEGHAFRLKKVKKRLDFIEEEFGFRFSADEVAWLFSRDNPGKPHIAHLMVQNGYAPSVKTAIETYLDRAHFPTEYVRPEEAIAGVLAGGGIPVLAHPAFGSGNQTVRGAELRSRIARLREYGLAGLEVFYSGFPEEIRAEVLALTEEFGLYATAGSDYHGSTKPIELGDTGLDEDADVPEGLARFIRDVKKHDDADSANGRG